MQTKIPRSRPRTLFNTFFRIIPAMLAVMASGQWCPAQHVAANGSPFPGYVGAPATARVPEPPSGRQTAPGEPSAETGTGDTGFLSSHMFPSVFPETSNVRGGYLYTWGGRFRDGRLYFDYTLPVKVGGTDVAFGQTQARFQDFFRTLQGSPYPVIQWLIGGGYRKRIQKYSMVGLNCFCNSTRINGQWNAAGIFGAEVAFVTAGEGIFTFNYNYYSDLFQIAPGDHRALFAYSHPMVNGYLDLALKTSYYELNRNEKFCGWMVGTEATLFGGSVILRYDMGRDPISQDYKIAGLAVNVGIRWDKIIEGKNPFGGLR
jgi:hypothetical protein